jgi:hypothetical protein
MSKHPIQNAHTLLPTFKTPDELFAAVRGFNDARSEISERAILSSVDQLVYHQIYPLLSKLLNSAPGQILILIVKELCYLLSPDDWKVFQPRCPTRVSPRRVPRTHQFVPLAPLKEKSQHANTSRNSLPKLYIKCPDQTITIHISMGIQ